MTERSLKYSEAICEALDVCLAADPQVFLMGLGAPDPTMLFGTHKGLAEKYGPKRVVDMPISENAMTGVLLGAAQNGMRPVMSHIRLEFAMLAIDQIVNQAAKWHYMFGGKTRAPMVIRMLVGRGWGQGPQHSQSLQSWFAHVPGLKVIMPATAYDAKGLMIAAIEDDNPVVCIEHRWLYNVSGPVPEGHYSVPMGVPKLLRQGNDLTIAASSYMTLEATRAADALRAEGIEADVLDVHTLNPMDETPIVESVHRTGNLIVADTGWRSAGFAAEISSRVVEQAFSSLKHAPVRITLPDIPTPTTRALSNYFYPGVEDIKAAARRLTGGRAQPAPTILPGDFLDVPDPEFTGPF